MTTTGWAEPDAESPGMPTASLLLSARAERGPVDPWERARLAGGEPDEPADADERAANLLARGYNPGHLSGLSRGIAEAQAELAGLEEMAKGAADRKARATREHQAGRVNVWGMQAMMDGEEPDLTRMAELERRIKNRQRELADAQAMIAAQREQVSDGVESAARHAHRTFVEVTRQRMAAAQSGR